MSCMWAPEQKGHAGSTILHQEILALHYGQRTECALCGRSLEGSQQHTRWGRRLGRSQLSIKWDPEAQSTVYWNGEVGPGVRSKEQSANMNSVGNQTHISWYRNECRSFLTEQMCWMDNGGKSCLKEFDLASILWPSVGKKNHQVICTCFPRVNPTQQRFNSWRWKTHFSVFYPCLLCAWSNKSIHWSAFPTLSAGHSLLYLFEFSWSICYYELPRRKGGCYLSQIITLHLPPLPSL